MQPQATGYPGSRFGGGGPNLGVPGMGGGGGRFSPMTAQPTGYGGGGGMMLQPAIGASSQPFLNTFMPAPGVQQPQPGFGGGPFGGGGLGGGGGGFQPSQMQFAQQPQQQPLQQQFQQQNQQQVGQAEVKVPWKLSSEEKKSYDQIFRAWDASGTGFIDGKMSVEVFAQSGLPREDLMTIWCVLGPPILFEKALPN